MATPEDFKGTNATLLGAPEGSVGNMRVFRNGLSCTSKWRLSPEELEEVVATGCVFISVYAGDSAPPIYMGSESTTRDVLADNGVWIK